MNSYSDYLMRFQREAAFAALPAALAALLGPLLVATLPGLRNVAAEYLPAGPERLLVMAVAFGLGAEIVRSHVLKFNTNCKLRAALGELARLRQLVEKKEVAT